MDLRSATTSSSRDSWVDGLGDEGGDLEHDQDRRHEACAQRPAGEPDRPGRLVAPPLQIENRLLVGVETGGDRVVWAMLALIVIRAPISEMAAFNRKPAT